VSDRRTFAEVVSDTIQDLARDAGVEDVDTLDALTDDLVPVVVDAIEKARS